jgi:hypothetical protein
MERFGPTARGSLLFTGGSLVQHVNAYAPLLLKHWAEWQRERVVGRFGFVRRNHGDRVDVVRLHGFVLTGGRLMDEAGLRESGEK